MPEWNKRLRAARRELRLSPGDLARICGLSEASVRAYEVGRRRPTRDHLSRVLKCLQLDLQSRNEILIDAGLAPEATDPPDASLSRREAIRLIRDRPWPAFVLNEVMEVVGGNRVGLSLAGLTPAHLEDRVERSVLLIAARVVAPPARNSQLRDWGVISRRAIARMKAAGVGTLDDPDPYFAAILDRLSRGGPELLREFASLWDATPPHERTGVSWSFAAGWTLRDGSTLRLHCLATRVNTRDPIEIHDFIPADATSAAILERVSARRR
jgi:transcriptional regulator with XRE-family HTH domain